MEESIAKKVSVSGLVLIVLWIVLFVLNAPFADDPAAFQQASTEEYFGSCMFSDRYGRSFGDMRPCPGNGKMPFVLYIGIGLIAAGFVFRKKT